MKHTTFENDLRDIKHRAIQELHKAVQAHGKDIYEYTQFDHLPRLVNGEDVSSVFFMGSYAGIETDNGFMTEADLTIEDILKLTDYIVETDEVEDVSGVYPVPVIWLDEEDLSFREFITDGMTQEKLNKIAEVTCQYILDYCFFDEMEDAAKHCGLKQKEY